ncbi:hypothetical protein BH20ACI3_BH20ACI3_10190 [soil metagenome]
MLLIGVSILMLVMLAANAEQVPVGIAIVVIFVVAINLLLITASFLAGYALLKRKRWAKTRGIIVAMVNSLSFPLGTALSVYTLWFLFGESGRFLYHKAAYALPHGDASWPGRPAVNQSARIPRHRAARLAIIGKSGV